MKIMILSVLALMLILAPLKSEASTCHAHTQSWHQTILNLGGVEAGALLRIYAVEGLNCYVGDHGRSFGPFQLRYPGMGSIFTRQTGLNARNPHTVPAQIAFMRRWGSSHGGFSSSIWHGLRHHTLHSVHRHHHHRHHWRH